MGGDTFDVDEISGEGMVLGRDGMLMAQRTERTANYDAFFTRLQRIADKHDPGLAGLVDDLKAQVVLGTGADDQEVATLIADIVKEAPSTKTAILDLFLRPEVIIAAGDTTRFVLGRL